jgi:hypothetical protein
MGTSSFAEGKGMKWSLSLILIGATFNTLFSPTYASERLVLPTWSSPAGSVSDVVQALGRTDSGKLLLDRARTVWGEERTSNENSDDVILRKIQFGLVSKTDAVLTRHYQPETKAESRTRTVTVILKKNETLLDQVLDLAHELIHALAPPSWDPYDPSLSPGRYIYALLEKKGGEIEAVSSECQVAGEIEAIFGLPTKRCDRYFDRVDAARAPASLKDSQTSASRTERSAKVQVNRLKIQRDFYRVGKWNFLVKAKLKDEAKMFPLLSQMEPELYSATGRAPYPAALLREYEEITQVACTNVWNRKKASRPIASFPPQANQEADVFLQSRCPEATLQRIQTQSSPVH